MKEIMIKVDSDLQEKLLTDNQINIAIKYYSINIVIDTKAYLTDGENVFGYAIVKAKKVNSSSTTIVLESFKNLNPNLRIGDFNRRSNQQLKSINLDAISVTKRSIYEENLIHFIKCSALSEKSSKSYLIDIRQFLVYLSMYSKSIDGRHTVNEYQSYLKEIGLSKASIQRKMVTIKRFLCFEGLNNLDQQLCIINKSNRKMKIISLDKYEILKEDK